MKRIVNIILSIIFGVILVILTNNKLGSNSLLSVLILLFLVWPLIWFGDHLGFLTTWWSSFSSITQVNKKSPASLVVIMGWLFLLIYFFFIINYQV